MESCRAGTFPLRKRETLSVVERETPFLDMAVSRAMLHLEREYRPILEAALSKNHTHGRIDPLPWIQWRIRYDPEAISEHRWPFYIHRTKRVEIPCGSTLTPLSPMRFEIERRDSHIVALLSGDCRCSDPSVPGAPNPSPFYAAARCAE